MTREIRHFLNLTTLSCEAAALIVMQAEESVKEQGVFTMALSGGRTPQVLYASLAQPPFSARMPWPCIHLFWGDERCVPPDHPDSNFAMAYQALIAKVPVPSQNTHRVQAELEPPEQAAAAYEQMLREFFQSSSAGGEPFPSFDLILLGVGEDGHTASLFPGDPVLKETRRWVKAVWRPTTSPPCRITLTLPVLNHARCVVFLVSDPRKREVVQTIVNDPETARRRYPAAMVRPRERVIWLIDEGIASSR